MLAWAILACAVDRSGATVGDTGDVTTTAHSGGETSAGPVTAALDDATITPTTDLASSTSGPTSSTSNTSDLGGSSSAADAITGSSGVAATTGAPDPYGKCGWAMQYYYYACEDDDGAPGLEDPDGFYPILCADEFVEGAPCGPEEAPFDNVGCCTLEGILFFCDTGNSDTVFRDDCSA